MPMSKQARVVNIRDEDYDVYCGRNPKYGDPKWGNPFTVKKYGREGAIRKHREWIRTAPVFNDIEELRGKVLGCHCAPRPCHGDTLLFLANSPRRIKLNDKHYPPKRFLICGIREWPYYFPILMIVGGLKRVYGDDIVIIHGAQSKKGPNGEYRGVDQFVGRAARQLELEEEPYPADWKKLGRAAGPIRNQQMLDEGKPDRVIAVGSD